MPGVSGGDSSAAGLSRASGAQAWVVGGTLPLPESKGWRGMWTRACFIFIAVFIFTFFFPSLEYSQSIFIFAVKYYKSI